MSPLRQAVSQARTRVLVAAVLVVLMVLSTFLRFSLPLTAPILWVELGTVIVGASIALSGLGLLEQLDPARAAAEVRSTVSRALDQGSPLEGIDILRRAIDPRPGTRRLYTGSILILLVQATSGWPQLAGGSFSDYGTALTFDMRTAIALVHLIASVVVLYCHFSAQHRIDKTVDQMMDAQLGPTTRSLREATDMVHDRTGTGDTLHG